RADRLEVIDELRHQLAGERREGGEDHLVRADRRRVLVVRRGARRLTPGPGDRLVRLVRGHLAKRVLQQLAEPVLHVLKRTPYPRIAAPPLECCRLPLNSARRGCFCGRTPVTERRRGTGG